MQYGALILSFFLVGLRAISADWEIRKPILEIRGLSYHVSSLESQLTDVEIFNMPSEASWRVPENFSEKNRIIKDKAMYRYLHRENLRTSFLLGDEYRFSINSTYAEGRELGSRLAQNIPGRNNANNHLGIYFKIHHLGVPYAEFLRGANGWRKPMVRDMIMSVLRIHRFSPYFPFEIAWKKVHDITHFDDFPSLVAEGVSSGSVIGNGYSTIIFGAGNSTLRLSSITAMAPDIDFGPSNLYAVDISSFWLEKIQLKDYLRELYANYARIYLYSSRGEEVLYISPGVRIRDFLKEHFQEAIFSDEGKILQLGDDSAEIASLEDLSTIRDRLWIQYPESIRDESVFLANRSYIFIHTSGEELLSQGFLGNPSPSNHTVQDKLTLTLDHDAVYYAEIRHTPYEGKPLRVVNATLREYYNHPYGGRLFSLRPDEGVTEVEFHNTENPQGDKRHHYSVRLLRMGLSHLDY